MIISARALFGPLVAMSACLGPTTPDGTPNKLALRGDVAYAALAGGGVAVLERDVDRIVVTLALPEGAARADDVAVTATGLFVLDAGDGAIWSYDLSDPREPRLASMPIEVEVGAFSGIAAGDDLLIVSGGTSPLSVHRLQGARIGARLSTLDLDRGQPDVAFDRPRGIAVVSTHFADDVDGAEFGITTLAIKPDGALEILDRLGLPGAGFTDGLSNPSNFPIQSAFVDGDVLVAHGGGVSRVAIDAAGGLEPVAALNVGAPVTAISLHGQSAFVTGAGETPRLVEIDLASRGALLVREVPLAQGSTPLDVVVDEATILVASFGLPLVRLPR